VGRRLGLVIAAVLTFFETSFVLLCAVSLFLAAALFLFGTIVAHIVQVGLSILAYPLVLVGRRRGQRSASPIPVRQHAATLLIGFLSSLLAGLGSAVSQQLPEEPRSSVTVLVDLSATWLNPGSRLENEASLKTVAKSVLSMASDLEPPLIIRYLPIGDLSLGRHALCEVLFLPKLLRSPERKKGEVTTLRDLRSYLETSCLEYVLNQKQEMFTDITSALDSAVRITDEQLGSFRGIIVLSDLKEERRLKQKHESLHLNGRRILLLYRILNEDRIDPSKLDARIDSWKAVLTEAGAKVLVLDDQAASPGQISRLLIQ
jgi:hypothetical protein